MKSLFFALSALLIATTASAAQPRVLMVVNEGYRPEEYLQPRQIFEASGFKVEVAARYPGPLRPSRPHWKEVPAIQPDLTFDHATVDSYDAVVFVGGNGAWNDFLPNPEVHRLLLQSVREGKITGLICAATGLLATAGNLDGEHPQFKGVHATGYFEVEGLLKREGLVHFDNGVKGKPYVVKDGNLITGRDPISATLFGETVASAICKTHHSDRTCR